MDFFDKKDYSTSQLSFFSVIISSIVISICCLFFEIPLLNALIILAISGFIGYFVVNAIIENYIAKKIKLIYKLINQTKSSKREQYFNEHLLPQKTVEEVKTDVELWATEKKDEIELLRKNEQFRKEFLMNLTHEVRTPIFNIQGYIDTLLNGALEDPQVNRKFLQNAANSVERLVHLVNDLHEISKLESGSIPLVIEHFQIQEIVLDVFEEVALKANEKHIRLEIKSDTKTEALVDGDKNKYKQVLTNLIENGIFGRSKFQYKQPCTPKEFVEVLYPDFETVIEEDLETILGGGTTSYENASNEDSLRGLFSFSGLTYTIYLNINGSIYSGTSSNLRSELFSGYTPTVDCTSLTQTSLSVPLICDYKQYINPDVTKIKELWRQSLITLINLFVDKP